MGETVSDFLVQRLYEWGVRRIYGYPGDGINGIQAALWRADDRIDFVQTRHEEMAALMACAHAKFTGEVGVCLATSGPGAIHLLNGLYDAHLDHQPVVAIVGQAATYSMGADFQQEIDAISLFKDVAHAYVQMATSPLQIRHLLDRAFRISRAERAVTCLIIPKDLQEEEAARPPSGKHGVTYSGIGYAEPRIAPRQADLERAARLLNEGEKVAILVGAGALHATDEVMQAADLLGAGVAKALLGKAALPDDLPYVTGSIGLLGTEPSWELMKKCDTLLMVGSSFPYVEFLPEEGQARGVQIDLKARNLSLRYPMEVNLHGDSKETLQALIPLLERKRERSWREEIEASVARWWKVLEARAMNDADPINPQRLFWELSPKLPASAILTSDAGTAATWYARDIKIQRGMMGSLSGTLATMGSGVPYAVAAKFAFPERLVVAMVGDGAMQMLGINGLITVAKYWKEWRDPRLIVLVLNNRDLNMVTWEQRVMVGVPRIEESQALPDFPFAGYAESLGLKGIRVERPEQIAHAWDEALASDRPVVVEACTDPDVPPLPPHISLEQARAMLSSMLKGDPSAPGVIEQSIKDLAETFLPHRE